MVLQRVTRRTVRENITPFGGVSPYAVSFATKFENAGNGLEEETSLVFFLLPPVLAELTAWDSVDSMSKSDRHHSRICVYISTLSTNSASSAQILHVDSRTATNSPPLKNLAHAPVLLKP